MKKAIGRYNMDTGIRWIHPFPGHMSLPYYMEYAGYRETLTEPEILRDMEYLQQVYPGEVKFYQKRIAQILDKMDYEGSMIYDEYPDYASLRNMADSMVRILKQEEAQTKEPTDTQETVQAPVDTASDEMKWTLVSDMVQILLCDEICKRRHGGRRGNYFWMDQRIKRS